MILNTRTILTIWAKLFLEHRRHKFLLMVNHSYNKQGIPTFLLLAIDTRALDWIHQPVSKQK